MSTLDLIISVVPGLMTYFWLEKLGHTPGRQLTNLEQTALAAILWVPTFALAVLSMKLFNVHYSVSLTRDISKIIVVHVLGFLCLSVVSSYLVALLWVSVYRWFHWFVNLSRRLVRKSELTEEPTVWESFFGDGGREAVIQISKIGTAEKFVGEVQNSSRPMLGEHDIILVRQEYWGAVVKCGNVRVTQTFVNTDVGLLIEELSLDDLLSIVYALIICRHCRRVSYECVS